MKISAITAIKGNASKIFECIRSLEKFATEIIVADIGMDSALKQKLLENKLVRMLTINKPVPYIELIREELKQAAAYEYVLFFDPDEVMPQTLLETLKEEIEKADYIAIPRKNIVFGKWIEHSRWWPDYQIRFFKKSSVVWPTKIHAQPQTTGTESKLPAHEELAIVHYNYESIDEFMQKFVRYTKAEAEGVIAQNKTISLSDAGKRALSEFIGRYFAAEGYKDGMHGFVLAIMQMFYFFLVYFYYWEQKKYFDVPTKEAVSGVTLFFRNGLTETNHWKGQKNLISTVGLIKNKVTSIILSIFS